MALRESIMEAVMRSLAMALLVVSLAACQESEKVDLQTGQPARRAKNPGTNASNADEAIQGNDALITVKVKTALFRDPQASGFQISVNTYRGLVQLSGFVDTLDQKRRAGEIARHIEGVRTVHNDLIVTSGADFGYFPAGEHTSEPNFNVTQSAQGGKP
jgi:osmotically-inducible protein OsmY